MKAKKKPTLPRKAAQRQFLKGIQLKIRGLKMLFEDSRPLVYRVLLHLLDKQLAKGCGISINDHDLPDISWDIRQFGFSVFCRVEEEIRNFQNSEDEGGELFARLLKWIAGEIARPYLEYF